MLVVDFHTDLLTDLVRLVGRQTALVPPGWAPTASGVAAILAGASPWAIHYPDDVQRPPTVKRGCVLDGTRLVAAAEWSRPDPDDPFWDRHPESVSPYRDRAVIEWIVASPDHPAALRSLLEAIVEWSRVRSCTSVGVGGRCPFGVGWGGIPTSWHHVLDAFLAAGFVPDQQWVILTSATELGEPAPPPALAPLTLRWRIDEAALEWEAKAFVGSQLAGECLAWGVPRYLADCAGYDQWTTIEWIGVEEPFRRKGLGRYLLQEQARRQADRGIRRLILWAECADSTARRFYEALGFTYGPECWKLVLEPPAIRANEDGGDRA